MWCGNCKCMSGVPRRPPLPPQWCVTGQTSVASVEPSRPRPQRWDRLWPRQACSCASCAWVLVRVAEVGPLVAAAGAQLRHAAHPALASGKFEENWVQQAILWVWRGGEWRERACSADCAAPCTRFRLWVGVRRETGGRRTSEASRSCWWCGRSWRPLNLRGGRIM